MCSPICKISSFQSVRERGGKSGYPKIQGGYTEYRARPTRTWNNQKTLEFGRGGNKVGRGHGDMYV